MPVRIFKRISCWCGLRRPRGSACGAFGPFIRQPKIAGAAPDRHPQPGLDQINGGPSGNPPRCPVMPKSAADDRWLKEGRMRSIPSSCVLRRARVAALQPLGPAQPRQRRWQGR